MTPGSSVLLPGGTIQSMGSASSLPYRLVPCSFYDRTLVILELAAEPRGILKSGCWMFDLFDDNLTFERKCGKLWCDVDEIGSADSVDVWHVNSNDCGILNAVNEDHQAD